MITGVVTVAVLWRGPPGERPESTRNFARLAPIMEALSEAGLSVEPMLYADEQSDVVLDRLLSFQAVLVWADPIDGADTRIVLDATLRRASEAGVWVSAHPNTIDKIGTKEVLYRSKSLRWGMDTHLYTSAAALRSELPSRLADGSAAPPVAVATSSGCRADWVARPATAMARAASGTASTAWARPWTSSERGLVTQESGAGSGGAWARRVYGG